MKTSKKKKVCLVGPTYPFRGGIAHYTTLLYRNLRKHFDVYFFAFKRQYPKLLYPGKTDKDLSKRPIIEEGAYLILSSFNPLSWILVGFLISRKKPVLFILPWWNYFWIPQYLTMIFIVKLFSKKTKVLFLCHNVENHEFKLLNKILSQIVLRRGDFYIVHSEEELERLRLINPGRKAISTFHPVYDIFFDKKIPRSEARSRFNIEGNIILFFGFIRDYKGLNYLLEAMPLILKKIKVKLLVAGEFWENKTRYINLIKKLNIKDSVIIKDGYVANENVPYFFCASNLLVIPYTSVTGSGVVQMAIGAELPVVTTNISNLDKIIKHGETGYIVSPRDPYELAQAIIKYFVEKKEAKFRKNICETKYLYSWEYLVKRITSFLVP